MNIANLKRKIYRHGRAFLTYTTPKKFFNFLLCEFERRTVKTQLRSYPYIGILDVTNVCNLRCTYCPTGKRLYGRDPGRIDLAYIDSLLQEVGPYLYIAHLFNWGEPLLHKELKQIIQLVRSHGVSTSISTNLNISNTQVLEDICDAGLEYLAVSIDGASQEVYSQYRVGGDLQLVLDNLQFIAAYKKRKKLKKPVVEWQFLIFEHNKHEVKMASQLAKECGVEVFNAKSGIVPEQFHRAWNGCVQCPFLWNTTVVQVDGGLSPCCNLIDKADDFGNISLQRFKDVWNSPTYQVSRSLFSPKEIKLLEKNLINPCLNCSLVRQQPTAVHYLKKNIHYSSADYKATHDDNTIAIRTLQTEPNDKIRQEADLVDGD